jgi:hypothetical protein
MKYKIIIPQEEPKQVICRDKLDRVIQHGYYVDVQTCGVHRVYRKEDGQLYFTPYGEEERVSNYFSNDLILTTIASKNIADLKKEIADKKQEEAKQEKLEELAKEFYSDEKELMERIAFKRGYIECKERMCDETEPKPLDNLEERFKRDMSMVSLGEETLEAAADRHIYGDKRKNFIRGAEWQEKRMFSEEEVKQIIDATLIEYSDFVLADIPEWFEHFKKK